MAKVTKGYWLKITTWENDADNFSTQQFKGLTAADVRFYLELAGKFRSKNARPYPGLGNIGQDIDDLRQIVGDILQSHPDVSEKIVTKFSYADDEDFFESFIEMLGETIDYADWWDMDEYRNFCRVYESFELFLVDDKGTQVAELSTLK